MNRWLPRFVLAALIWVCFPQQSPAPIIYTPGEGIRYEPVGGPSWRRQTAKEQLEVAQKAFEAKDYSTALKAARRITYDKRWRLGEYAGPAQYLVGRCYEIKGQDEKAFKAYQKLIEDYPKVENYDEIVQRQYVIANRFLAGKYYRVWGYVPLYRSMSKTITLYEQIVKNGPYNEVAPAAQMKIGQAHENKKGLFMKMPNYEQAAKAYQKAAERYADKPIGTDAMFNEAMAYTRQARLAEYDQTVAGQAIATFTDFIALHPEDPRVPEAQKTIESLRTEQARGSYEIARFYEKKKRWDGALIYYNEVLLKDPSSKYASVAREKIVAIKKRRA